MVEHFDASDAAALAVARRVASRFGTLPEVVSVALGGSRTAGMAGPDSDIDLYVYAVPEPDPADRLAVAGPGATDAEIGARFWEPGDTWREDGGPEIDAMYRSPVWIEAQLDRVLVRHEAAVGYSTCFWHNVLTSVPLHDPTGWFTAVQTRSRVPYPDALRAAVVAKNHPLLRQASGAFLRQIAAARDRGDGVAVQHRVAGLLASWFDVLFALNRLPHPGEKRLVAVALDRCALVPPDLPARVDALLRAAAPPGAGDVVAAGHALIDPLDDLLIADGLA